MADAFFLEVPKEYPRNAPSMEPIGGKLGKKPIVSSYGGDGTTTCYDRAK